MCANNMWTRKTDLIPFFADRFEEMRPFLFLVFPRWFVKAYPALMGRVQTNAARHTTPLDVHTTLLDVLFLNNADAYKKQRQKTKHGISLFQQVGKPKLIIIIMGNV